MDPAPKSSVKRLLSDFQSSDDEYIGEDFTLHISDDSDQGIVEKNPIHFCCEYSCLNRCCNLSSSPKNLPENFVETTLRISLPNICVKLDYQRGSVVWAKVPGYHTWPAMVDNDPDTGSFYWRDVADPFTFHYHVVFFDVPNRLSRYWCTGQQLRNFDPQKQIDFKVFSSVGVLKRFVKSIRFAKRASKMSVKRRIKQFCFNERAKVSGTKLCED